MVLWDGIQISKNTNVIYKYVRDNRVLTDCVLGLFILYWTRHANSGIVMRHQERHEDNLP